MLSEIENPGYKRQTSYPLKIRIYNDHNLQHIKIQLWSMVPNLIISGIMANPQ